MVIEHLSDVCMADCYNLLLPLLGCLHEQQMTETEVSGVTFACYHACYHRFDDYFKFHQNKSRILTHIFFLLFYFYRKKLPLNQIPCCKPFFLEKITTFSSNLLQQMQKAR
jgi:hypothetical protein